MYNSNIIELNEANNEKCIKTHEYTLIYRLKGHIVLLDVIYINLNDIN